jgi:hypothetical protein
VADAVDPRAWDEACRCDDIIRVLVAHADSGQIGQAALQSPSWASGFDDLQTRQTISARTEDIGHELLKPNPANTPLTRVQLYASQTIEQHQIRLKLACAYRKSNPGILVVQSAQNRATENAPNCLGGA